MLGSSRFFITYLSRYRFSIKMRAFIILTVIISLHLGSSIIYCSPLKDVSLEIPWDNISIQDLQLSFNDKNEDTMKTISKLNERFLMILMSSYEIQKLIRKSLKTSQIPTEDIDLGTKNLWVLENEAPISYLKYNATLNCQLKSICEVQLNNVQIQSNLTLRTTIQTNGTKTRAYVIKPMDIIVRGTPSGAINTTFNYEQSPTVQIYSQSETENLQVDDNKLNSIVIQLKPKIIETLENFFPLNERAPIEISKNSTDIASNIQRPNLYSIPDPKVINTTDHIHQLPQCIVENVKKDIGEITNSNFIVVTEGLSNFSNVEMQGNFTVLGFMQMKIELKIENSLRGKFLWEFSSKQNSNNYSSKVDFTIDHLCIKTEVKHSGSFSRVKPELEVNVDVGKLQFKTSVVDVIENEEKFSQCLRSFIAESVSTSSKEAIKFSLGFTKAV